jgi:hypothetical protein
VAVEVVLHGPTHWYQEVMFPSAIGPRGWLLVAILWACLAGFIEFHFWRGKLAPLRTSAVIGRFRMLLYGVPSLLTLVIAVISIRPVWHWYSTTEITDFFGLGVIVTGAITAWAGSLVAFTISKRVTPRRAFGLRLLSFALLIAVLPMGLSGTALRSVFLTIALTAGIFGRFQASLIDAMKETKFFYASGDTATNMKVTQRETLVSTKSTDAFSDWLVSFVHGGPYWMAIAFGALVVFVFPSSRTVTATAGAALLWGMRLIYRSIVEPFTPQFFGDALEEWRKEHFTMEPPKSSPPAIADPPATDDKIH